MTEDVLQSLRESITKTHDALKKSLARVRTGRASAQVLENIRVDYYGVPTPLNQMSSVNVPEPRLLTVKPFDKTSLKAIEKAIREAELGLNPQLDGDSLRIPIPALTEERRKEMVKIAKKSGEECKVAIRNGRRDAMEKLSSLVEEGAASEDEIDRGRKKVEDIVTEGTKKADEFVARKEKDILE